MRSSTFTKKIKTIKKRADKALANKTNRAAAKSRKRDSEAYCSKISHAVDDYLVKQCSEKANTLSACKDEAAHEGCSCGGGGSNGKVDLVVLIDSSSSMDESVAAISTAAEAALKAAKAQCGEDVRVNWFWVDDVKGGSTSYNQLGGYTGVFTQSHQQYLEGIGATGPFYHDQPEGLYYPSEQGADAIADISEFYDWRDGACRSVFYVSNARLEGESSDDVTNDIAVTQAVSVANANDVTVFAHAMYIAPRNVEDYTNLTEGTGGAVIAEREPSTALYKELLVKAICECGGGGCKAAELPDLEPCISVRWGDSECDGLETDDVETLCISVCNCYTNVTFSNFRIGYLWITDENGRAVPTLPDGTPSVQAIPLGPVCFGDIPPCSEDEPSCVTRDFVVVNRGAKPGKYKLSLSAICYDITQHFDKEKCFEFELCRS